MTTIHKHNVFEPWPLEDKSVQAVITSPPYWGLRKYDIPDVIIGGSPSCEHEWIETMNPEGNGDGKSVRRDRQAGLQRGERQPGFCSECGAWKGQHGLEPSFRLYIEHVRLWAREVHRVLKDDGVFFLNLGDSYATGKGKADKSPGGGKQGRKWKETMLPTTQPNRMPQAGIRPKTKLLIPHRVAIALCDDGWILRNDIVWHKKNAMPLSVKDRFSGKYESVFLFSKQQRYYFDLDAVRERPINARYRKFNVRVRDVKAGRIKSDQHRASDKEVASYEEVESAAEKGKNPGDVWAISVQSSPFAHYAMFPEKLVERMIRCSTRPGDTVLDPFCGSGTTLLVAEKLNRIGRGIDLGYEDIQAARLNPDEGVQKELNLEAG